MTHAYVSWTYATGDQLVHNHNMDSYAAYPGILCNVLSIAIFAGLAMCMPMLTSKVCGLEGRGVVYKRIQEVGPQ